MEHQAVRLSTEERLHTLEQLVDELLKDSPEETKVRDFMTLTGIPYTKDPIERINSVLKALHFHEGDKEIS